MLHRACSHHLECYQHIETDSRIVLQNVILCSYSLMLFSSIHVALIFLPQLHLHKLCDPSLRWHSSICWPCFAVSATHTYGLISVDFCKCYCANSGRSASRHTACMPSPQGTKRKWQGNCHSVSIAMEAQAWLFIPRLMGWRLELKVPDWKKHVPVLFKTRRLQTVVSHHSEESLKQVGITKLTYNFTNIIHSTSSIHESLMNTWLNFF